MIGQPEIKSGFGVDVAVSSAMANALQTWSLMYANTAPWLTNDIKSLNLSAAIAGEIARATTIELEVKVTGGARADFLSAQLAPVLVRLREKLETGMAKGGLIFKPYVEGREIDVNFIQADQFYPVAFGSDGDLTGCIFADQQQIGSEFYTRLEYHRLTDQGYQITNRAYRSSSRETLGSEIALSAVDEWASILPDATIQGIDRPLFAYFRYPLANNVDPASPLGVSCYSRAVDQIEQADRQWTRLLWEFESGERAMYVDTMAFGVDDNNKPHLPNKRLYRTLSGGGQIGDSKLFEDWSPTIREQNLLNGLDAILKKIEFACGLAYGTLSDPQSVEKTATEIASARQRSQATVKDNQNALRRTLDHLLYAMDVWCTLNRLAPAGTYQTAYDFDDSLIVDSEGQFSQDSRAVTMGVMPKWQFLMRNYGLTEEQARQWIADTQAEQPRDMFGAV